MKKITLLALALFASTAFAKEAPKASPAKPAAATAKMDVTGTLKWTGYGVGKSHTGDINIKSGSVEMQADKLTGGTFVLDMTTLNSPDSPKLVGHLKSEDFFDIAKYPEATFKITKVEALKEVKAGGPNYKITGDLTIKNKTHSEDFLANIQKKGNGFEGVAGTEIKDRTQYDIVYNSGKFKAVSALGDKLIQDNIKVDLDIKTK